jgi:antitoxin FitA
MATLTIKNIPDRLIGRLKQDAKRHRRSVNSEVIVYLERALTAGRVNPEDFLETARAFRQGTKRLFVTDRELREAKRWGRL